MIRLQAHRGVSSEYPENTLAAFETSVREGYDIVECDPKYTKDGELVILHDKTVNRTGRTDAGESLPEGLEIRELTLAQAKEIDVGLWKGEEFRGERIPTLAQALDFAAATGMPLKIDNCWEKFPEEIREKLLDEVERRGNTVKVGFTCAQPENLRIVAERFPACELHYDGGDLTSARLAEVAAIAKGHRLTIWVCFDNKMTGWFKGTKATREVCQRVAEYGEVGIWILSDPAELPAAIHDFGAKIIETTGHIKPEQVKQVENQKD